MMKGKARIGIDAGSDRMSAVLIQNGKMYVKKVPTRVPDLWAGIENCLKGLAERAGLKYREMISQTGVMALSSDIVASIVADKQGPRIGLLVTKGFEDRLYATGEALLPKGTIVPEDLIRGIDEEVDATGKVTKPVSKGEVFGAVKYLTERGAQAIAICLRNAFCNPAHEKQIMNTIDNEISKYYLGGVGTLCSHEISTLQTDYLRLNTTVVNLYGHRNAAGSLRRVEAKLREAGLKVPTRIVSSSIGGLKRIHKARTIDLIADSEVASLLAGAYIKRFVEGGSGSVVVADMGFSSTTVGVIKDDCYDYELKPTFSGLPLDLPIPAVMRIPVGGASVARQDGQGGIQIGPETAGASPGPVCYDQGGTEPTVMDADMVLGYMSPDGLGYRYTKLDREKAAEVIREKIAGGLKISVEEAARRIKEAADRVVAEAIGQELALRGFEPTGFDVYATGDFGGVHGCGYGQRCGAGRVVMFPTGRAFSAFGAATADIVFEYRTPFAARFCDEGGKVVFEDLAALKHAVKSLREAALNDLEAEGDWKESVKIGVRLIVKYSGGEEELVNAQTLDTKEDIRRIIGALQKLHPTRSDKGIELVAVMVEAGCPTGKVELAERSEIGKGSESALKGKRSICWKGRFSNTDVYAYEKLGRQDRVKGPAVIEEEEEIMAIVPEEHELVLDRYGNGIIKKVS